MADHEIASGGSNDDAVRLVALAERQRTLWTLLREAEDEQTRNRVFDELTANRREIAELKEKASARGEDQPEVARPQSAPEAVQPPRSIGEQLRAKIVAQPENVAPPEPPPPPPPPPIEVDISTSEIPPPKTAPPAPEPPSNDLGPAPRNRLLDAPEQDLAGPEAEELHRVPAEPLVPGQAFVEPESHTRIPAEPPAPEQAFVEPESHTPVQPEVPVPGPVVAEPEPAPSPSDPLQPLRNEIAPSSLAPESTPYRSRADDLAALRRELAVEKKRESRLSDEVMENRRRAAHERYESISRVRPRRSPLFSVFAIGVAIAAVAIVVWFRFFHGADGMPAAPPTAVATSTTTTTTVPVAPPTDIVAAIQEAVAALDLGLVSVTEQVGTIVLSGFLDTEPDRQAVIDAAQALAGSKPVDTSRLKLTPTDEEIRAAVEQTLGSDSYSDIVVSASDGVAILTGVVNAEARADLTDAVAAVDGVARVVDATRTRNVAAELAAEVRSIGGPNPITYESGQLDLTAEQQGTLDEIAQAILAYPGPYVTVVGYTDPAGGAEENRQISQARADLVRNYLIAQGVPAARLATDGRGEDVPAGVVLPLGLERRVEFEVGFAVPPGVVADFRIGIVAPSSRSDRAFTQSMAEAADLLAADRDGVGIEISEGTTVEDAAAALRSYAASGYDLVIAHGRGYGEAVAVVAAEYPGIAFAWGPGSDTFDLPNVSAYDVAADEGAYVMGAIAASLTDTGAVGIVGSLDEGESRAFVDGFAAGVAATDSDVEVLTAFTGSTSDVTLAAGAATAHIAAGADVLTGTDAMAVDAITVATENNAIWFGNQVDQSALAEDAVVASQVYHWEMVLRQVVAGLDAGARGGQAYTLTLSNGGLAIAYNPAYELAPAAFIAADTIINEIISGAGSGNG